MKKRWLTVIAVLSVLAWSAPVSAGQGRGHGRGHEKAKAEKHERAEAHDAQHEKHEGREKHEDKRPRAVATRGVATARKPAPPIAERTVVIDRDGHRRVVTEFFSREALPPGLAKRQSLPPGLQKQLQQTRNQLAVLPCSASTTKENFPPVARPVGPCCRS